VYACVIDENPGWCLHKVWLPGGQQKHAVGAVRLCVYVCVYVCVRMRACVCAHVCVCAVCTSAFPLQGLLSVVSGELKQDKVLAVFEKVV